MPNPKCQCPVRPKYAVNVKLPMSNFHCQTLVTTAKFELRVLGSVVCKAELNQTEHTAWRQTDKHDAVVNCDLRCALSKCLSQTSLQLLDGMVDIEQNYISPHTMPSFSHKMAIVPWWQITVTSLRAVYITCTQTYWSRPPPNLNSVTFWDGWTNNSAYMQTSRIYTIWLKCDWLLVFSWYLANLLVHKA